LLGRPREREDGKTKGVAAGTGAGDVGGVGEGIDRVERPDEDVDTDCEDAMAGFPRRASDPPEVESDEPDKLEPLRYSCLLGEVAGSDTEEGEGEEKELVCGVG
jgi:hypothetical protein